MASILGIDTIQHQSGTTAMTIDNSGRINVSNVPRINLYHNTNGHLNPGVNNSFFQDSVTIRYQSGITYSNDSNGRFTVPIAGVYYIGFKTIVYDVSVEYAIRVNGTEITAGYTSAIGQGWELFNVSTLANLNANDYVAIILDSASGGTGPVQGHGGSSHSCFDMAYIGG
jgi:hypothetical protein